MGVFGDPLRLAHHPDEIEKVVNGVVKRFAGDAADFGVVFFRERGFQVCLDQLSDSRRQAVGRERDKGRQPAHEEARQQPDRVIRDDDDGVFQQETDVFQLFFQFFHSFLRRRYGGRVQVI